MQPVIKLLLDSDGEELRILVVKEAIYVTEAIVLGTAIDTYNSIPGVLKTLISNGSEDRPFKLSTEEQGQMLALRDQVMKIWDLLRLSRSFDPSILQPIVQVFYYFTTILWSILFLSCEIPMTKIHNKSIDHTGPSTIGSSKSRWTCCWRN